MNDIGIFLFIATACGLLILGEVVRRHAYQQGLTAGRLDPSKHTAPVLFTVDQKFFPEYESNSKEKFMVIYRDGSVSLEIGLNWVRPGEHLDLFNRKRGKNQVVFWGPAVLEDWDFLQDQEKICEYRIAQLQSGRKWVVGKDVFLPEGVKPDNVSDGYHTFGELYEHRCRLFAALMTTATLADDTVDCGWSKKHADGAYCFSDHTTESDWRIAWITTPSGLQARYHIHSNIQLPPEMEAELGSPWNGKDETFTALQELTDLV